MRAYEARTICIAALQRRCRSEMGKMGLNQRQKGSFELHHIWYFFSSLFRFRLLLSVSLRVNHNSSKLVNNRFKSPTSSQCYECACACGTDSASSPWCSSSGMIIEFIIIFHRINATFIRRDWEKIHKKISMLKLSEVLKCSHDTHTLLRMNVEKQPRSQIVDNNKYYFPKLLVCLDAISWHTLAPTFFFSVQHKMSKRNNEQNNFGLFLHPHHNWNDFLQRLQHSYIFFCCCCTTLIIRDYAAFN